MSLKATKAPIKHANPTTNDRRKYRIRAKTHYVTSDAFDIDKLTVGIDFFNRDPKSDYSVMMMKFKYDYEYAIGLVSELNILHEKSRVYSARLPPWVQADPDLTCAKVNAPIRYDNSHDTMLKATIDLIKAKLVDFLIEIKGESVNVLTEKYCGDDRKKIDLLQKIHSELLKKTEQEIEKSFEPQIQPRYDSDIEDEKPRLDPEIFRMLPRIRASTKITKLGSKKSGYQNEVMNMRTFYESLSEIWRMNNPDSEYFFECNMIVGIKSYYMTQHNDATTSFRPDCSKFEYKLNKAACKRVIKRKKIEQPIILQSLSV